MEKLMLKRLKQSVQICNLCKSLFAFFDLKEIIDFKIIIYYHTPFLKTILFTRRKYVFMYDYFSKKGYDGMCMVNKITETELIKRFPWSRTTRILVVLA